MSYRLYDADLALEIKTGGRADRWLILEEHPTLINWWLVDSLDPAFRARMGDTINRYQAVGPFSYDAFAQRAAEEGYEIAFLDDPAPVFAWLRSLYQPTGVVIESTLPDVNEEGMFPFQRVGVNMMKYLSGGMLQWSTGTGKSVGANALVKWHKGEENFDLCLFVCKRHNRINVHRSLRKMVHLDSYVLSGTQARRDKSFAEFGQAVIDGQRPIMVMNYEPFRNDLEWFKVLVEGRKVLIVWDEMSAKLRNRGTKLYKAVAEVLYTSQTGENHIYYPQTGKERPAELRQLALTATPIYKSPEDYLNCIRIIDPSIWPNVGQFHVRFVSKWDHWALRRGRREPAAWKNLDLIGAETAHIVHQVDKRDPDIAKWFPDVLEQTLPVELHDEDRKLYDLLAKEYTTKDLSIIGEDEILSAVQCLQMIASNPASVLESAQKRRKYLADLEEILQDFGWRGIEPYDADGEPCEELAAWERKHKRGNAVALKFVEMVDDDSRFTDKMGSEPRCAKTAALLDLVENNDDKCLVFTRMNRTLIPKLSAWFDNRQVSYVVYAGGMKSHELQQSEDRFKADPEMKVFLSTDAGSDSIDLEMANLCVHYDQPWDWATKEQRQNRQNRITSKHVKQRVVSLIAADTVEERVEEIVAEKRAYHDGVLKGEIAEQAIALRHSDLVYVLTGRREPG